MVDLRGVIATTAILSCALTLQLMYLPMIFLSLTALLIKSSTGTLFGLYVTYMKLGIRLLVFGFVCFVVEVILRVRIVISGDIPVSRGVASMPLVLANHSNLTDWLFLICFAARMRLLSRMRIVAKKELFLLPFVGSLFQIMGLVPINRTGGPSTLKQLIETFAFFIRSEKEKSVPVIFPEGTNIRPSVRATRPLGDCEYVIRPKAAGTAALLRLLNEEGVVDCAYQVTLGYRFSSLTAKCVPGMAEQTVSIPDVILGSCRPVSVHMNVGFVPWPELPYYDASAGMTSASTQEASGGSSQKPSVSSLKISASSLKVSASSQQISSSGPEEAYEAAVGEWLNNSFKARNELLKQFYKPQRDELVAKSTIGAEKSATEKVKGGDDSSPSKTLDHNHKSASPSIEPQSPSDASPHSSSDIGFDDDSRWTFVRADGSEYEESLSADIDTVQYITRGYSICFLATCMMISIFYYVSIRFPSLVVAALLLVQGFFTIVNWRFEDGIRGYERFVFGSCKKEVKH